MLHKCNSKHSSTYDTKLLIFIYTFVVSIFISSFASAAEKKVWNTYQTPTFSGSYFSGNTIDLLPGTHGLTPQLSLTYNSYLAKNKAGWVGAGWEIPISYIQTNTDGTTFSLILNGARHKLILAADGRYHTTIETYLKIDKKTGAENEKGAYWTVTDTSGTEYRFGSTLDSENIINTSDPAITPYVWRWSLDRIQDSNGNCIYYTYSENPTANDKGAVYLKTIEYNTDKQRLVEFILEDTDRPDMSTVVDQGSEVQEARRLAEIRVSVKDPNNQNSQLAKKLVLQYILNPTSDSSLLVSITKYGSDETTHLPPENFEYTSFDDGTQTDLLTQVTGSLGEITTINYSPSSSAPNTSLPENYWLVTSITQDNGMTGAHALSAASIFAYENGAFDLPSQEFRGFGKVSESRADGSRVIHLFHQDERKGREQSSQIVDAQNAPYLESKKFWSAAQNAGVTKVRLDKTEVYSYDGALANFKTTRTEFTNFDDYGNVGLEINHGDIAVSGDETYIYREFIVNPDLWIVNKVKHSTFTTIESGTKLRESWYYYDRAFTLDSPPFAGNLTKVEQWNSSGTNPVISYKYDSYGNLTRKTDPLGYSTEIVYDTTYQTFPELVYNAKGHLTTTIFNPVIGKPVSVTDSNDYTTTYTYDALNRLKAIIKPYDSEEFPTTEVQYMINNTPPHTVVVKNRETAGGGTSDTLQVLDGLGKPIQTKAEYNATNMIAADTYYDVMGRGAKKSNPYLTDNSIGYSPPNTGISSTQTGYDVLGRPKLITNPDNTSSTVSYDHWTTDETDENGHVKSQTFDANKNLVQVVENNQGAAYTTTYQYSPVGELLSIKDHLGNISKHQYDSLGRKTTTVDADLGQKLFSYDLAGNLTSQTDARGTVIQYQYDALGRQTLIDYPNDKDTQFVYDLDKKGTLSRIYNALGVDIYTYDNRLRTIQEDRKIDDQPTWITKWDYDSMDRVTRQTYPDGEVVQYSYSSQNKLDAIQRDSQTLLNGLAYNPAGQLTQKSYGNGWNTAFTYDAANQRLLGITTTKASDKLQDLTYTYDNVDNVKMLKDAKANRTETFTYDDLGRLLNAQDNLPTNGFNSSYLYDAIGNLTKETDNKTASVTQYTYGQGTAKPHAVTGKTNNMPVVGSFVIDNGKAICTKQQVTLNNISFGNPTHYMASENADFSGAAWIAFSTAPVFTLSSLTSVEPTKKIYFKVKNTNGESPVKSDDIQYLLDTDGDGIPDVNDNDDDNDGIPDIADIEPLNPGNALLDPDHDGLTNLQEYIYKTDPNKADSDGDGWSDYDEIFFHKTNPNLADTDSDGIPDPEDPSPNNPYNEGFSVNYSTKKWQVNEGGGRRNSTLNAAADTLGNGFSKSPLVDTDGDGIPDVVDVEPLNPTNALLDSDGDGLTNLQEYLFGTNPMVKDTDGDGWSDYQEIFIYHTNPNATDSDNDGIPDTIDPEPNKQTFIYGISTNFTIRSGSFNAGGNRRNGVTYAIASDKIGGFQKNNTIYNQKFSITPNTVDFASTEANHSRTAPFTISNKGNDNLIIGTISLTGSDLAEFDVLQDNCSAHVLSPSVSCTTQISFIPKSQGAKGASLEIQYNDGETQNASIAVSGIATQEITPLDTTITGNPINPTNSTTATFAFISNKISSTFACQLDNTGFMPCTSPKTYSGLTNGIHLFEAKADNSGNIDLSPATYTWTINTTLPDPQYVVSATANSGGSVTPSSSIVTSGAVASFMITANNGYTRSNDISGTCPIGSWSGNTYSTGAVTSACSVSFSFSQITSYTVLTSASIGGTISPNSRTVSPNTATTFTITPTIGYSINSVNGCGGSLVGDIYTTGMISCDCTVVANFKNNNGESVPLPAILHLLLNKDKQ